jgi:hypothetical protein
VNRAFTDHHDSEQTRAEKHVKCPYQHWQHSGRRCPDYVLKDEKLVAQLPVFLRTLSGQKPSREDLGKAGRKKSSHKWEQMAQPEILVGN